MVPQKKSLALLWVTSPYKNRFTDKEPPFFFLIFLLSVKGQEQKEQGQAKLEAARAQQDRMGRVEQFEGKAKQIYGIITGDDAVSFCSYVFFGSAKLLLLAPLLFSRLRKKARLKRPRGTFGERSTCSTKK